MESSIRQTKQKRGNYAKYALMERREMRGHKLTKSTREQHISLKRPLVITAFALILILASGCRTARPAAIPPAPATPTSAPAIAVTDSTPPVMPGSNRSIFREGLTREAQAAIDALPDASLYQITLQIPEDFTTLKGHETITYTNQENDALDRIYVRLFPNAAGGKASVSNITVDGAAQYPIYEYQDSAFYILLPEPLEHGEQLELQLDFDVTIPREQGGNFGLFGYFNAVLILDTFYPVIPVYDDEGWNVETPPVNGDWTYFDASFYRVHVTAPAGLTLVASGTEIAREEDPGEQIITFAAGPARDFYLAASERYTVISQTVGETTLNSYALEGHEGESMLALYFADAAFKSFNTRFGPYPYTEYDIVSIPMGALGIEYPGVVGLSLELYDRDQTISGLPSQVLLESAIAHETAHQWFYNVVGNDQVDEPWLDEALAQYATGLYYEDVQGATAARNYRASWLDSWNRVDQAEIPIGLSSADYTPEAYAPIVYGRGPFFITALAEALGQETFDDFLRDYYTTHQWGISTRESFKQLAETHCQCDLTALFEAWVMEPEYK